MSKIISAAAKAPRPSTARGEATKLKILNAAEKEIGEKGFHGASVSTITRQAGVAQGTFYLYFKAKEDALRELVVLCNEELRRHLHNTSGYAGSVAEKHEQGLEAFLEFSKQRPNLVRVIVETSWVDPQLYQSFYLQLADSLALGLSKAKHSVGQSENGAADMDTLAWILMGINHFLSMKHSLHPEADYETTLKTAKTFVRNGLNL